VKRFLRVPGQTILSPLITTALYFVVFGWSLGGRLREVEGVPYIRFLVPGLVMLTLLTQSVSNASFGIYFPRFTGTIYELLSAPVPAETTAPQPAPDPHTPQPARSRPVLDPEIGEFVEVAIHERGNLLPGALIPGPAVIVEDETSTVVTGLFDARIDAFGYIELTRRQGSAGR